MTKKTDDWFYSHIRQVHMDFHMPEFPQNAIKNFNAQDFVKHLVHGKINMVALFAKCHFGNSFYNTGVGHKHAGLPNDFLMEAATECRKHGIKTLAYYSLSSDARAYDNYPQWRKKNADGSDEPKRGAWGRVCVNSSYREELVLPQLEEIARDYPVDGFFIDIPLSRNCFCEGCRKKFEALHGKPLDETVPVDEQTAFDYNSTGRFLKEFRMICNKYNPDLKIVTNRGAQLRSTRYFSECNDIGVWESQPHSNYLSHSFAARHVRTLDMPVQIMSVRFYRWWGDLSLKSAEQMTTEFAAMIGNGCAATSGDQVNVDGTLQPPVYDMFHKSFGFVEEREDILFAAETVKDTALIAPVPSATMPSEEAVGDAMHGAHKALVECHVQFDILSSLDIDKLDDYRVAIFPEPYKYDPAIFPEVRNWVEAGGTLIAVGTSLIDGGRFHLQDVLGIEYLEPSIFPVSHFTPRAELKGELPDIPLQCRGQSQKVIPTTAETLADYIYPQTFTTPDHAFRNMSCPPASDEASMFPFTTINRFGKGRAVYIAGSIFDVFWKYNHLWLRQFIDALYSYLEPEPLYRVDMSGIIEANLMEAQNGDLLLNLIHYQVGHQGSKDAIPAIEKIHPIRDVPCEVKVKAKRLLLEPEGTELDFDQDGDYARFVVPLIKYLGMVRIVR